eukprot:scaffold18235_cov80-Skeletonema_menzelii.AAC.1
MDHVNDDGDIFIYRGGRAPQHVTHVRIDESVDEIEEDVFRYCRHLLQVDTHDGIRRVGAMAFLHCTSLRRINLTSAVEIGQSAFYDCENLESVEFGDRLETIGYGAFSGCTTLKHLKLPTIITIRVRAFCDCTRLINIELSERLETIEAVAFLNCERLQRIAIPLKRHLFEVHQRTLRYTQFDNCEQLTTIELVGGIQTTIASLHMDSWRIEMIAEINLINQVLSSTPAREKTNVIRQWMDSVMDKMDHYKAEHCRHVKEGITLLELALWKDKLLGGGEESFAEGRSKKAKVDA